MPQAWAAQEVLLPTLHSTRNNSLLLDVDYKTGHHLLHEGWTLNSWPSATKILRSSESCKGKRQKERKTKKIYKKVQKIALAMRLVIDCLGLALKKKRCIITHVITELEHKHRTGFFSHCIIASHAVFTSDTDHLQIQTLTSDTDRNLRYRRNYRPR